MKIFVLIILLTSNILIVEAQQLLTIKAHLDTVYKSFDTLQNGEVWGWHSGEIGKGKASSTLNPNKELDYKVENLYDLELTTAWIEGSEDYGIGEFIEFTISSKFPYNIHTFNGHIEIFNGYCKNERTWNANSRVKKMKLYFNGSPFAILILHDSWQQQYFRIENLIDIKAFKEGDVLKFEILEVYPGDKYKDVAISELITPSYGGG